MEPETNHEQGVQAQPETQWQRVPVKRSQWTFAAVIVAYAVFAFVYHLLIAHNLGRSGAMFIGLPSLLAAMLALSPPARTDIGAIMKFITLALLLVAPLMGEGYLCILIASPLFYAVGAVVGLIAHLSRNRRGTRATCLAVLMVPFCLEGTLPQLSLPRDQSVTVRRIVNAPVASVEEALSRPPRIGTLMPWLLRIGFPRPLAVSGGGMNIGDERTVHFSGAETAPAGDLVSRVTISRPGELELTVVTDGTKLMEWMQWQSNHVTWRPVDPQHTEVTWTARFQRRLDPAWYFAPWQHVVVEHAVSYMITANATPGSGS